MVIPENALNQLNPTSKIELNKIIFKDNVQKSYIKRINRVKKIKYKLKLNISIN